MDRDRKAEQTVGSMEGSFPDLRCSQWTGRQRGPGLAALMEPLEAVVGTQEILGPQDLEKTAGRQYQLRKA